MKTITKATYVGSFNRIGDGHFKVLVLLTFSDNSTEQRWFDAHGVTVASLRDSITAQIESANRTVTESVQLAKDIAAVPANAVIPVKKSDIPVVPPTSFETWKLLASRLSRVRALGLTDPRALADIEILEEEVNASYQIGFARLF